MHDSGNGGDAQHGGHTPNNGLTEICSLGLVRTSLILNIHVIHRIHKWRPRGTIWFRMHENEAW